MTRPLVSTAAVLALLSLGVVAFGPVFGGAPGYRAAGGGVAVGLLVGLVATWRRWTVPSTVAAALTAYLLLGGAFALPATSIGGLVPTPETLQALAVLAVESWRNLLTVATPASADEGPAVVPFLSGLICAVTAISVALRTRRPLWALLPPFVLLVIAIAWGTDVAAVPGVLGVAFVAVALAWGAWVARHDRIVAGADLLTAPSTRTGLRAALAATTVLVGVVAASSAAVPAVSSGIQREVLRDVVVPPLDLREYASPLTSYRYFEYDQKDAQLFTVTGLPTDARLRLATLDTYDGVVYNVADSSAGFIHVGDRLDGTADGEPVSLQVVVQQYAGVWLPVVGEVRGVRFETALAADQDREVYYNRYGGTTLTTARVAAGDRYSVDAVVARPPARESVANRPVAQVPQPEVAMVPDAVAEAAGDYTAAATTAIEQLEQLELRLQEGYYTNGSDRSLAGHSFSRLAQMFAEPQLVGGDEQYAAAMALMVRHLGMSARVVMGFYPADPLPDGGSWTVTGADAHVWVEVPFDTPDGVTWVAFDPTPDRDREPITESPQPRSNPRPQVQPPPDPPQSAVDDRMYDDSAELSDGPEEEDEATAWLQYLAIAAGVVGSVLLLAAPFLAVVALKLRRRRHRRSAAVPADRVSGGWDEIVDSATDLGTRARGLGTRQDEAHALAAVFPESAVLTLARDMDARVFGPRQPAEDDVARLWDEAEAVIRHMHGSVGTWRRLVGRVSLRSFRRTRRQGGGRGPSVRLRRSSGSGSENPAGEEPA